MRVVISAYACEPHRGSEPAVGWNWAVHLAGRHQLTVVTRSNNQPSIEPHLGTGVAGVEFVYFDLPRLLRFWKRGSRGHRLYYVLWQYGAYRLIRQMHRNRPFDIVHHVTFVNYWLPTFLPLLNIPFVWGPVGGAESIPKTFLSVLSFKGRLTEAVRSCARWLSCYNPAVRRAARRARVALAATPETEKVLRRLGVKHIEHMSQVGLSDGEQAVLCAPHYRTQGVVRFIAAGALVPLKGSRLTVEAFAACHKTHRDVELVIYGDGPERQRLTTLAAQLRCADSVRFEGQVPREELFEALRQGDVFVHSSLRESGGYACAEAMAAGLPVICFNLGGPALLVSPDCGVLVEPTNPGEAIREMSAAMIALATNPGMRRSMGENARARAERILDWQAKADRITEIYDEVVAREAALV
jgi:glycosyltransferase involved in cell wall biosynthesis